MSSRLREWFRGKFLPEIQALTLRLQHIESRVMFLQAELNRQPGTDVLNRLMLDYESRATQIIREMQQYEDAYVAMKAGTAIAHGAWAKAVECEQEMTKLKRLLMEKIDEQ